MEGAQFGYWINMAALAMCLFQLRARWAKGCCVVSIWLTSAMVWTDYGMPDLAAIVLSGVLAFGLLWLAGREQRRRDAQAAARKRQRRKTTQQGCIPLVRETEESRVQTGTELMCTGRANS